MKEKVIFNVSGLVQDETNKSEIEFWGHDAGEFTLEEIEKILEVLSEEEVVEVKK